MPAEFAVVDDDGDAVEDVSLSSFRSNSLERLREAVEETRRRAATRETITIRLVNMEEVEAVYRVPSPEDLEAAKSKAKAFKRFGSNAEWLLLLARCNVALRHLGEEVTDEDGVPVTWASREIKAWADGAASAVDAANWFLCGGPGGPGGDILAHVAALLEAGGYGRDADVDEEPDPTLGR